MYGFLNDVSFTPERGHSTARLKCPLSANGGHLVTRCIFAQPTPNQINQKKIA